MKQPGFPQGASSFPLRWPLVRPRIRLIALPQELKSLRILEKRGSFGWEDRLRWNRTFFLGGGGVWNGMKMGGNWMNFWNSEDFCHGKFDSARMWWEDLSPRNKKHLNAFVNSPRSLPQNPPPVFSRKICSKSLTRNIQHQLCWVGCGVSGWSTPGLCIFLRNIECLRRRSSSILCWSPKQALFEKNTASCQTNVSVEIRSHPSTCNMMNPHETSRNIMIMWIRG